MNAGVPDPTADQIVALLAARGAGRLPHARGRTLLAHLIETAAILRRWGQPPPLQHAALIHSVLGTERYRRRLLTEADRPLLARLAGADAERLAHLFATTPRRPLLAGTLRWSHAGLSPEDHDALVMLHMANLAEQAAAPDGSPTLWLVRLREMAELIIDSETVVLPDLVAPLMTLTEADERAALRAYTVDDFALAAAINPVIPEPCLRLGGDGWIEEGRRRAALLGTAWDKRETFRELAATRVEAPAARVERFHRYVERLATTPAAGALYPDLPSNPFHEPAEIPLARALEGHADEVREEILALPAGRFRREAERIARAGAWDVVFLYERGRRHDEACAACPVTARIIEAPGNRAMTRAFGLIYVSRMGPGTHIAAHRGPTNLRLRCHLGLRVPDGDCAIRVGGETRRWQTGEGLVFDDSLEHEAWNHTAEDRIVLIADLWHPALTDTEVTLLGGLHDHIARHGRSLARYWDANALTARPEPGG